jgi:predicted nucleotidyltransferase
MIEIPESVRAAVAAHPYPLVFASISGAHLYGFASEDSDYDIRGVHVLPLEAIAGLDRGEETIERMSAGPPELDLVTHDAEKFFRLLLKPNGYVLEQLFSPLVLLSTPEHLELVAIARGCITRQHLRHYVGFGENQWRLFEKEDPPRVKPLLYVFRVLLTGIHLLQTGEIEASLVRLNEDARLPYVDDLIARKTSGTEKERLSAADVAFYRAEYDRLMVRLIEAGDMSTLPDLPTAHDALNDLLLRLRGVR